MNASETATPAGTELTVLADTSCWIEFFHPRGSQEVKAALRGAVVGGTLAVCGPVICEVVRGATRADRARIRSGLQGQVHLRQEDADWEEVGHVLGELQQKGLQPPVLDALIAVIAARHGAVLWHFGDRHFDPIGTVLNLGLVDLKG